MIAGQYKIVRTKAKRMGATPYPKDKGQSSVAECSKYFWGSFTPLHLQLKVAGAMEEVIMRRWITESSQTKMVWEMATSYGPLDSEPTFENPPLRIIY